MALVFTKDQKAPRKIARDLSMVTGTFALDSSYPAGGEVATGANGWTRYFKGIQKVNIDSVGGYKFEYDYTNNKVKAFAPAPPIVYEEVHTIPATPYQVTLDYPAAALINVCSATAHYPLIEPSDTLASGEVQLASAMAAGTRTVLTFEATQTTEVIYVTYITQAWRDVWLNRSASQAFTPATEVVDFLDTACYIESCKMAGATGASYMQWTREGDAADAADEAQIIWTDAAAGTAGDTTITFNDTATAATITWIKKPTSGFLKDRFVEDFDCTASSGVSAANCPVYPVLFQSLYGQVPDYTAANERDPHISQMLMSDDLAGGDAEWKLMYFVRPGTGITGHVTTGDADSDAVSLTYVWGVPEEIPGLVPLEVRNATDLSALSSVRVEVVGYH
jgi:hypothetical protein